MYAVPLMLRLVSTTRFNKLPSIPNVQMIGNRTPYDSFLRFSVRGSSNGYSREIGKVKKESPRTKFIKYKLIWALWLCDILFWMQSVLIWEWPTRTTCFTEVNVVFIIMEPLHSWDKALYLSHCLKLSNGFWSEESLEVHRHEGKKNQLIKKGFLFHFNFFLIKIIVA